MPSRVTGIWFVNLWSGIKPRKSETSRGVTEATNREGHQDFSQNGRILPEIYDVLQRECEVFDRFDM